MKGYIKNNLKGIIIAAAGLLLIISGIGNGSADSVLSKAARICLECIGIG